MNEQESKLLITLAAKVETLIEEVRALKPLAEIQAVHSEQIKRLDGLLAELNARQWWLVGLVIGSLLGAVIKICIG